MKNKLGRISLMIIILLSGFTLKSCVSVKSYQKMYLNDAEMELAIRHAEKYEQNFLLYREGSSGANGGKSGGGCGCN